MKRFILLISLPFLLAFGPLIKPVPGCVSLDDLVTLCSQDEDLRFDLNETTIVASALADNRLGQRISTAMYALEVFAWSEETGEDLDAFVANRRDMIAFFDLTDVEFSTLGDWPRQSWTAVVPGEGSPLTWVQEAIAFEDAVVFLTAVHQAEDAEAHSDLLAKVHESLREGIADE